MKDIDPSNICNTYHWYNLWSSFINFLMGIVVILCNKFLRDFLISRVMSMGCDTQTVRLYYITTIVFACEMFNTGILMLLVSGNFKE